MPVPRGRIPPAAEVAGVFQDLSRLLTVKLINKIIKSKYLLLNKYQGGRGEADAYVPVSTVG